ncbi:SDR family oxidoreductase [Microlunatus elymi]|uniref:SDR family oxidoreductase n=1 Tax=Microlunatus elymi TaxID=2596828 RepID=A0A516PY86_9ACTN|nr:SDR family oxidoreductase [Microlunatus elymi]QDP96122.1 SDR family oxidoreductase [Microlunatus elymi]
MSTTSTEFPTDRTAIVTGAGGLRGIGRHVARRIAREGWSLALVDIDAQAVQEFAAELDDQLDQSVIGIGLDVTDQDAVRAAFSKIDDELPPVLALINLAGISCSDEFMELTPEIWDRVMAVNAKGSFLMMQQAAQRMIDHGLGGRIVNTASLTAYDGGGTFSKTAYAAAKAAVLGLTRGGARELGKHKITVNAIVPGPIDTDIMGGTLTDDRKASMSAGIPLQRVGQPAEVAGLINYLISDEAGYTNGASYAIDGGKHMF